MKLRNQVMALGLAGTLLAMLTGGIGLVSASHLSGHLDEALHAAATLQASQEADMMHDAIRGDAQLALLGALEQAPERIAEAEQGVQEHGKTFERNLATMDSARLSVPVRQALQAVKPLVQRYLESARAMIQAARSDADAARKLGPGLQTAFLELEREMARLSDAIESDNARLNEAASQGVQTTRYAMASALLVAAVLMTLASLWLVRQLSRPMSQALTVAQSLAQGDLGNRIQLEGNLETQQLLQALAEMQSSFAGIVREVKRNADEVASASTEIAHGNQDLSDRTEQQANALQRTTSTMAELDANVRNNAESAEQARGLAEQASSVARNGGEMMGRVIATMGGINSSSRKIADIIGVIDDIAFQTNILALNAAVEAARAGEQGRGFAVVASEVRGLAQRSAAAAREIKDLIDASVNQVEQGTGLVNQTGQTMDEIVGAIGRVSAVVAEISRASGEQSAGVREVGQAVAHMDQATQQNAALVEQSAAAADSLSQQAQQLVRAVAAFRLPG
ncbi:methyl-accepting chemotaxis protein [Paucibacter sp. DJ1R-11]|uniref:methyl-accepting chemotaxis protein n=1 Tax=Paucibacter sp. DJ1R-11 TaxID=2893556 RepID=UPI0021E3F2CC|nr:methyl-accepting chemotaxis protein [Paucibacter sp. DJ1R-11]MCV2365797.1 methyl-accepting chemotaxis protein [Paucibacter sp. DJ1R-11]